jgi:hypothetical protein
MPFPTLSNMQLSSGAGLPDILLSIRGALIDPTSYTVAVSQGQVPAGGEKTAQYTRLFDSPDFDARRQVSGPTVASVNDLNGRVLKWMVGLTSLTKDDAPYEMIVQCGQGALNPQANESGNLDHGVEFAHGYIRVTVS